MCFGLEECHQYDEAEKAGREAIDHTPNDIWAIHSIGHIYEETLRGRQGLKFLEDTAANWQPRGGLVTHMWWHTGLFNVQLGDFETALSIFDDKVIEGCRKGIYCQ